MSKLQIMALFLITLCLGCNQALLEPAAVEENTAPSNPAPQTNAASTNSASSNPAPSGIASSITSRIPGNDVVGANAAAEPAPDRVKAQVGVAKQGRSLDNETGIGAIIAQPARSLFAFKEKAVFDIQIPQALSQFKATEGRAPNSNDEFMTKIIKANNIQLPVLPAGQTYDYDPQRGELMVLRPKS